MLKSFVFVGDVKVGRPLAENLTAAGFLAASDVAAADVVFTYCESQSKTEDVYFETDGLVQTCREGAVLVDLGATSPSLAKEIQAVALVNDMRAVDAPLMVEDLASPDAFARKECLSVLVGGDAEDFQDLEPMLRAFAGNVSHAGPIGSGQIAKAVVTIQEAAQVASLMEADALCRASNVDAASLVGLSHDRGVVSDRVLRLHEAVRGQRFDGAYTLEMLMGEVNAALAAADDVELILPQAEAAMHLLELLAVIGGSDMGVAALGLIYGDESECAKHGLDWSRAEEVYGHGHEHGDDCGCGHDHDHDDDYGFDGYDGDFGDYSNN